MLVRKWLNAKSWIGGSKLSRGLPWSEEDERIVKEMHANKHTYQEIAERLGRTYQSVNGFIYRLNFSGVVIPRKKYTATPFEDEKRRNCHARGMTDRESAEECNVSYGTYASWRINSGLKCNPELKANNEPIKPPKPARKFEPADIKHYKHNTHTAPANKYSNPITIIVDKELAEKEFEKLGIKKVAKLKNTPIIGNNIVIVGSKWTEPDSYITAPKDCKDRMRNHG